MRPILVWGLLGILYAAFFVWYTPFGGPLSDAEVERYTAYFAARSSDPEALEGIRRFLSEDTGDDFVMVNLIEMRDVPTPVEGVEPGDSARDVLDRYMAYMWPALLSRACHPVAMGQAASDAPEVWGIENARHWSMAGLMRYRSRRDMLEIAATPEFNGPHEFKIAAMAKTIAFPADPWFHLGDPRLLLGLVALVLGLLVQLALGRRPGPG